MKTEIVIEALAGVKACFNLCASGDMSWATGQKRCTLLYFKHGPAKKVQPLMLAELMDCVDALVLVLDARLRGVEANRAAMIILGYQVTDLLARTCLPSSPRANAKRWLILPAATRSAEDARRSSSLGPIEGLPPRSA
jgi:PAS domain-containing protein